MTREAETKRDARILERYTSDARELPPVDLDGQILAAARRAVQARPSSVRRWQLPVSLAAAVLVGFGLRHWIEPAYRAEIAIHPATETRLVVQAASPRPHGAPAASEPRPLAATSRDDHAAEAASRLRAPVGPDAPAAVATARLKKQQARIATAAVGASAASAQEAPEISAAIVNRETAPAGHSNRLKAENDAARDASETRARLEQIRSLLAEQRIEEAWRQLQAFRRDFPGYGHPPEPPRER
ncbi:MAG: hypothetical protein LJE84_09105 [Gammaproteobacteria bacterium]|jgi:hypothetical protein|nr:hypothetical protein [Gammaproteobacteria bacterium]